MKNALKSIALVISPLMLCLNVFGQPTPPGGGGSGNTNYIPNTYMLQPYVPGLKLSIPPASGTNLFINLLEADPAGTYDIFAASNIVSAPWNAVLGGTNGQTNFTLPFLFTNVGFFRAARTDTPVVNTAGMTANFPNGHVNDNLTSAIISGGPAAALAVLVNDTNLADAVWIPFSAIPNVLLGTNDGTYSVIFGFIGSDGQTNWTSASVTSDTRPPSLFITGPTNNVVNQPIIQLTGYSPEALASLSYDINNASGLVTNQPAFVLDQFYDTNVWKFTTNTFQAFDIPLTNGLNIITLHATDLAGNSTILTTNFTLGYSGKTNPPTFNLVWPQNGEKVTGCQFSFCGQLDDFTASLSASLVDTNGVTNVVEGIVERDGKAWLEYMPLIPGTNLVAITFVNAAGYPATTNLTVINVPSALTINEIPDGQLTGLTVSNVSGTVTLSNYTVWVNGVQATQDGAGNWDASNVPIGPGGTAVIQARAIPNTDNGGQGSPVMAKAANPLSASSITAQWEHDNPNAICYLATFSGTTTYDHTWIHEDGEVFIENVVDATDFRSGFITNNAGGGNTLDFEEWDFTDGTQEIRNNTISYAWPLDVGPVSQTVTQYFNYYDSDYGSSGPYTDTITPGTLAIDGWGEVGPFYGHMQPVVWQSDNEYFYTTNYPWLGTFTANVTRQYSSQERIRTGGKKIPGRQSLFRFSASALTWTQLPWSAEIGRVPVTPFFWNSQPVASGSIRLMGQRVGNDGNLYIALPDGEDLPAMPVVDSPNYTASVNAQKYLLNLTANGNPLSQDHVRRGAYFCVGQLVTFAGVFSPDSIPGLNYTSPIWNYTADYINNHWTDENSCEEYNIAAGPAVSNPTPAWFYNKQTQDATANLGMNCKFNNGQSVYLVRQGKFNVFTPSITFIPSGGFTVNVRHGTHLNSAAVLFGVGQDDGTGALGMLANINSIPKFPGQAMATQLVNRQASVDGVPFPVPYGTGGAIFLDNAEIYPNSQTSLTNDPNNAHSNLLGTVTVRDQPGIPITVASWASGNDQFNTYFRFRPDGDSNNIYVTLGRADWSWQGNVLYNGGVPYNPWLLSNWSITGAGTSGPTFHQVNDFPIWLGVNLNFP